ncbi:MAG: trigger factor [Actinomycetota bacterium]|nr:trigger factor [Actinomycetota bacterium]
MKTTLERLGDTTVKLTVEVEPERVSKAFDEAARDISQQVEIRGFRKGKAPRRLIEARLGKGVIAQHAMEESLSAFYAEAVREEHLAPVAPPEIDVQTFTEDEGCAFEATVEVRPQIDLPDHEGIEVTFPEWDVTDEEVRDRLDDMRQRFAELEEVDRPAAVGDYVTIDLSVFKDGEPIEGAAAEDAFYEVGSGGVTPRLDEELAGAATGHILNYTDQLPDTYPEHGGEEVEFRVLVKDVRAKTLPALDDDFAATASEFDTLADLEDDVRRSLRQRRYANASQELRGRVLEAYLALVDVPLPEAMVRAEVEGRLEQLQRQADQYGVELEQLLEMYGTDLDDHRDQLEDQAAQAVKAQLVLEALAEQEGLTVDSDDLETELMRHASRHRIEPSQLAQLLQEQGTIGALVGDVIRRKALDLLVDAARIEGQPSEELRRELLGEPAEASAADPGASVVPHAPSLGGEQAPEEIEREPVDVDPESPAVVVEGAARDVADQ